MRWTVLKKRFIFVLLIISLWSNAIFASSTAAIFIDGQHVPAQPKSYIESGRTYVPLRYITEELGFTVDWIEEQQAIIIQRKNFPTLKLFVGSNKAFAGSKTLDLDAPVQIRGDRAFVPIRFTSEQLGYKVQWNPNGNKVIINK